MIEKAKKQREPAREKLARCRIEADVGRRHSSFCIFGVFGICDLRSDYVNLLLRGGSIAFFGEDLSLVIYEGRSVEIKGVISTIELKGRSLSEVLRREN